MSYIEEFCDSIVILNQGKVAIAGELVEIKRNYPQAVLIMITPPSINEIRNRLIKRGTESIEKIDLCMQRIDYELSKKDLYDYAVVNDDLITAVQEIENIIKSEKNKI